VIHLNGLRLWRNYRTTHVLAITLLLSSLLSPPAQAYYSIDSCTVTTDNITFGTYNPTNAAATSNSAGRVTLACSTTSTSNSWNQSTGTVKLSAGAGTYTQRVLKSGTNSLNYNIYTDSAYTLIWGDGTGSTDTNTWAATSDSGRTGGATTTFTLYGRIPALQYNVVPGSYTDSITVTLSW
jgi:spore coat protein U-like protein